MLKQLINTISINVQKKSYINLKKNFIIKDIFDLNLYENSSALMD